NRLNPAQIDGSGKDGRITKSDIVNYLGTKPAPEARQPSPSTARGPASSGRGERRVPMTRLRARIAERLVQAQSTQALLTSFNEVDLKAVQELRSRYKDRFEKEQGVRLGFMSFFVKASIEALKRFPVVNASVEGADIVYHEYYDIGVAVSNDRGVWGPNLRGPGLPSVAQIVTGPRGFSNKRRER